MIPQLFRQVLVLSVKSIPLIGIILLSNMIFQKKINPGFFSLLWLLVFLRLMIPFSSPIELETISSEHSISMIIGSTGFGNNDPLERNHHESSNIPNLILPLLWIAGLLMMISIPLYHSLRLRNLLRGNNTILEIPRSPIPVIESDEAPYPFIVGILNPKIIIPAHLWDQLSEKERNHVLCHELGHFYRKDILFGLICYLVLAIHWFNPFVWISYYLLQSNKEIACDYRVTKDLSPGDVFEYARTLLRISELGRTRFNHIFSAGLTGKYLLQRRIEMIVTKRKKTVFAAVLLVAFSLVITLVFLVDPISVQQDHKLVIFDGLSQVSTPTSDELSHHASIKMQLVYDGNNKRLENELSIIADDLYDVTREYFNGKTSEQLLGDFQRIKLEMIERVNSMLNIGEIQDILFAEYKVFEY